MNKQSINQSMTPYEWGLLITLSILWGGSFFFQEVAVRELPTFTIVFSRVALAAVILFLVARLMGTVIPLSLEAWLAFFGMGLLNNVIPFTLIVWGQTQIASGLASILNATTPLFAVLVTHFLTTDEKATGLKILGVVIGFFGVAVMIGADLLGGLGDNLFAQLAILSAALTYGFAGVFGRRFKRMGVPPVSAAFGQVTASSVWLFPLMMISDKPWTLSIPSTSTIAALVALAGFSTALAYIMVFRILASAGATNVLLVTFLVPVSAILLGILVLGEVLETKHFVGMLLIGAGLAVIDGRLVKKFSTPLMGSRNP